MDNPPVALEGVLAREEGEELTLSLALDQFIGNQRRFRFEVGQLAEPLQVMAEPGGTAETARGGSDCEHLSR